VLYRIGGRPAAEVLVHILAELPPPARGTAPALCLGVAVNPSKYPLARGDFVVRNVVRVDADEGAIVVVEPVPVGATVQFHVVDPEAARQDLLAMLARVRARLANARPRFGFYINGVARGQALHGAPHHDVALIRESLGEFPFAGFFSAAELGPMHDVNCVHQYAGVLTVFA
jgi:small ligand-binding sensory domain FIST